MRCTTVRSWLFAVAIIVSCVALPNAQTKSKPVPDFNGDYKLVSIRADHSLPNDDPGETIHVVQSSETLSVTSIAAGKAQTKTYDLTGRETRETTRDGISTTHRARFEGNKLTIDSTFQKQGVGFKSKEKWTISKDAKTLKIETDDEIPVPAAGTSLETWTIETFSRIPNS
jgi:hypothetical protein